MTEIDTARRYLRKMDALMLDLTTEVDTDILPDEARRAIMIISIEIGEALKVLESEED